MPNQITYLDAVWPLHPKGSGGFILRQPHNNALTEAEYNAAYHEIIGVDTKTDEAILSNDLADQTVKYAAAKAKYEELKGS
tara:strand:- start:25 stop:267 length:243 start_codon:yes stop_codon:yes gene_type:complete